MDALPARDELLLGAPYLGLGELIGPTGSSRSSIGPAAAFPARFKLFELLQLQHLPTSSPSESVSPRGSDAIVAAADPGWDGSLG